MPAIHDASVNAGTEAAGSIGVNLVVTSGAQLLVAAGFVDVNADPNPIVSSDLDTLVALSGGEVLAGANSQALVVYYKQNPTVGTHVITNNWDAGSINAAVVAATFDGINAANPIVDATTDSGSDSSVSSTVPNVISGDLVIDFVAVNGNPAIAAGANQAEQENNSTGSSAGTMYGMSTKLGANGGVMEWTWTGAQRTAHVAVRLPVDVVVATRIPFVGSFGRSRARYAFAPLPSFCGRFAIPTLAQRMKYAA
jgi:hypothetical protein